MGNSIAIVFLHGLFCHCLLSAKGSYLSAKGSYLSPMTDKNASTEKPGPGSQRVQPFTSTGWRVSPTGVAGAQSRHLPVQSCMLLLAWKLSKTC